MSRPTVTCAANGCGIAVKRGMLMCKGHWFSLPKPLRDNVWRTWRRAFNAEYRVGIDPETRLRDIAAYREAVRAARDYLDGVPPTPAPAMATDAIAEDGSTLRFREGRML